MKRGSTPWWGLVVLVGVTSHATAQATDGDAPSSPELRWLTSEEAALRAAASSGQPLLIDFAADWSPGSGEIDRLVWSDVHVRTAARRFVTVRIDGSPESAAARTGAFDRAADRYRVVRIPTVILVGADGRIFDRIEGFVPAEEMERRLSAGERTHADALSRR